MPAYLMFKRVFTFPGRHTPVERKSPERRKRRRRRHEVSRHSEGLQTQQRTREKLPQNQVH